MIFYCAYCHSEDGRPVYRANEKGVPALWLCEECLPSASEPPPEVKELVNSLRRDREREQRVRERAEENAS